MEAGYLGVGAMGQPVSHKLLDAGHSLTIYDINEAAMRPLLKRRARRGLLATSGPLDDNDVIGLGRRSLEPLDLSFQRLIAIGNSSNIHPLVA